MDDIRDILLKGFLAELVMLFNTVDTRSYNYPLEAWRYRERDIFLRNMDDDIFDTYTYMVVMDFTFTKIECTHDTICNIFGKYEDIIHIKSEVNSKEYRHKLLTVLLIENNPTKFFNKIYELYEKLKKYFTFDINIRIIKVNDLHKYYKGTNNKELVLDGYKSLAGNGFKIRKCKYKANELDEFMDALYY